MMTSLIVVHYRTPEDLHELLKSIFSISDLNNLEFELIVVDNSGDLKGAHFDHYPTSPVIVHGGQNLGYAGGINFGVQFTRGERMIVMNADLVLHEGSLRALLKALQSFDVVGPKFFLDRACKWHLPPAESHSAWYYAVKILSRRYDFCRRLLHDQWWKRVRRHIEARSSIDSFALSGAMLGINRSTWAEVGTWDQNFILYFEEVDWLIRLKGRGLRSGFIPEARVTHFYNQSAQAEPRSSEWFEWSQKYFLHKHKNWLVRGVLRLLDSSISQKTDEWPLAWTRTKKTGETSFDRLPETEPLGSGRDVLFCEMSHQLSFVPSALRRCDFSGDKKSPAVSPEVWSKLTPADYYFRVIDSNGAVRAPILNPESRDG